MSDGTFGDLVKQRRLALGLSLKELGQRVGRSDTTVRNWETGRSRPGQDELYGVLASALEINEEELRSAASDDMEPEPPPIRQPVPPERPMPQVRSYRAEPREMVTYWIRAVLTAAALIVLFVILVWAFGELTEQLGGLFGE